MPNYDALVERLAFLATAGEILAASLDLDQTMQDLARLAVPVLADLCIVDVVNDGVVRRVATAHVRDDKASLLEQLRQRYPPTPDSPQPAARVLRSGQLELLEHVTPDVVASHVIEDDHARLIEALGIRSHLAVPLVARNVTLGVISLGITESDRRYGAQDVTLAIDLARRAAVAIDNARLYTAAQDEIVRRAGVEEALRLSEERFRTIVDQSPMSTQILAPSGRTLHVNPAWETLWGLTAADISEYDILADPQLEAQGITPLLRRAFAGESVHLPEIRYDPNTTVPTSPSEPYPIRWVRAVAYPVTSATGDVREVVLVHEDVTHARQAREQLRASEERLRLALHAGRMNVWDWTLATDVVECSDNAVEFWGREVGRAEDFISAIHPDDVAGVDQAARTAIEGRGSYLSEYRLRLPTGETRWVQSRGRVDTDGNGRARRILGVTMDVSDLKMAEETTRLLADAGGTLGASLDYHATLQNLTRLLVPRLADWCAVDLLTDTGSLERVSVHHEDPAQVALAHELFTRYPPAATDGHGIWQVLRTGQPEWVADITDEMLVSGARDDTHASLLGALQLRSCILVPLVARGGPVGVLTLVHAESGRRYRASDVTLAMDLARRAASAVENARLYQQVRAEDRRKDEFLATLAHELRNPLAPIRTGLALLRVASDPTGLEQIRQVMDRQLGHMVRLIDDLLDLSRVTRGRVELEKEHLDLGSIVSTAVEASRPLLDQAGVALVVRLPDTPMVLEADRTRLAQVLSNLLNNAAKFSPPGGQVELQVLDAGAQVDIRVSDTGIGIPRHMLTHIFEMFAQVGDGRTRSHGGLGIGLTLVRRLVELHDGRVWAESDGEGQGSTFVVRLPRAEWPRPRVEALADTLRNEAPGPTGRRVLVVDDNADAATMLATLLMLSGHEVRTTYSAAGALEVLQEFHADIAFLDIGMPGMSGYELARRIRTQPHLAGITLVAVTGWGQDEDRRLSQEAGLDHHLTKPVEATEVLALVTTM